MKFYGNLLAEAEFFHADRWTDEQTDRLTDITNLIVAFGNFLN